MKVGRRHVRTTAVALSIALATAACGGSAADSAASGAGSGSGEEKTVKVGMSSILSGPAASAGIGTDAGLMAYLKTVNDKGGINGHTFTFEELDNEYDPARAATVARQLIANKADLIVTEGSANYTATAALAAAAKIPLMTESDGGLLTPPEGPAANAFGVNPIYEDVAAQGAQFIVEKLKLKKAGLVYVNTATGQPARDAFPPAYTALGGEVVDTEAIENKTTDFTPFVQKLKQAGAPVVYAFVLDTQMAGLQKAAAAIGYAPEWVTWATPYTPSYLKLAGDLATGTHVSLFVTPFSETDDPNMKEYLAAMKKYGADQTDNQTAAQGWTFGAIIAKAVEEATAGDKAFTTEGFSAALRQVDDEPLGLVKSIAYNDKTHAGANKSAFYLINKDGSVTEETPYEELPDASGS